VKDGPDATIIDQSQEYVHSVRATLSPLGRDCDRPLQNLLGGSRSRQPSQHELVSHTVRTNDRRMQLPSCDAALAEQVPDLPPPAPREGEQQMLGLDGRPSEHPCLVLGQQNEIR
jgi:hypothetical protein